MHDLPGILKIGCFSYIWLHLLVIQELVETVEILNAQSQLTVICRKHNLDTVVILLLICLLAIWVYALFSFHIGNNILNSFMYIINQENHYQYAYLFRRMSRRFKSPSSFVFIVSTPRFFNCLRRSSFLPWILSISNVPPEST